MKNSTTTLRKLDHSKQTVRALTADQLNLTAGGFSSDTIYNTCRLGGGCRNTIPYGCASGGFSC
jgi:hypothetical protein